MRSGLRTLLMTGLLTGLFALPSPVSATINIIVPGCNETSLDMALAEALLDGDATITFICSGTISFTSEKTITASNNLVIRAHQPVIFDGGHGTRLFDVEDGATLELQNLLLQNAGGADLGGAIRNAEGGTVVIDSSTMRGNHAATAGGAIYNFGSSSSLTINRSTLHDNRSEIGGAVSSVSGTLTIDASTLHDNSAVYSGGALSHALGTANITSSTFSGNTADNGGAMRLYEGTTTITSSTLSGNSATTSGGGIHHITGTSLLITGSIIAGNTAPSGPNCEDTGPTFESGGSNLSDDASCPLLRLGDILNSTAIDLGPLQNNGGPTQTMLPAQSSDTVNNAASCPATDQRGLPRPAGEACEIGSVELQIPVVDVPTVSPAPSNEGQSVTASATFTNHGGAEADCTVDYGDGSEPQSGTVNGQTCTGPVHIYLDDDPTGTASGQYTVTIEVTAGGAGSGTNSTLHTVNNVAPVIESVTTNDPAPQGQPAEITVTASDIGVNDTLTYRFDCDNDGDYETAGAGSQGQCSLDPAAATTTIGIQVMDDDTGVATDTVEVNQTLALCGNSWTGALYLPTGPSCQAGTSMLTLPAAYPTTLCYSMSASLIWAPGGACGSNWITHNVPLDGPLYFCASLWTKQLSHSWSGTCGTYDMPGEIPGQLEVTRR